MISKADLIQVIKEDPELRCFVGEIESTTDTFEKDLAIINDPNSDLLKIKLAVNRAYKYCLENSGDFDIRWLRDSDFQTLRPLYFRFLESVTNLLLNPKYKYVVYEDHLCEILEVCSPTLHQIEKLLDAWGEVKGMVRSQLVHYYVPLLTYEERASVCLNGKSDYLRIQAFHMLPNQSAAVILYGDGIDKWQKIYKNIYIETKDIKIKLDILKHHMFYDEVFFEYKELANKDLIDSHDMLCLGELLTGLANLSDPRKSDVFSVETLCYIITRVSDNRNYDYSVKLPAIRLLKSYPDPVIEKDVITTAFRIIDSGRIKAELVPLCGIGFFKDYNIFNLGGSWDRRIDVFIAISDFDPDSAISVLEQYYKDIPQYHLTNMIERSSADFAFICLKCKDFTSDFRLKAYNRIKRSLNMRGNESDD